MADSVGMVASIACAIHCAAMPLVISYLPLLGLEWLSDESFHQVMAVVCFGLAVLAFVPGWRRHGSLIPIAAGLVGVSLLSVAAFAFEGECCPTCETPAEAEVSQSACSDAECPLCAQEECEATPPEEQATSGFTAWALPFMTPLGGVMLVFGHLVNHRKSCGCQNGSCCLETDSSEA